MLFYLQKFDLKLKVEDVNDLADNLWSDFVNLHNMCAKNSTSRSSCSICMYGRAETPVKTALNIVFAKAFSALPVQKM